MTPLDHSSRLQRVNDPASDAEWAANLSGRKIVLAELETWLDENACHCPTCITRGFIAKVRERIETQERLLTERTDA